MKLSKIVSCLVPIATIGVTTPILTSCGGNGLVLTFGDSINCLFEDKEHTEQVTYHSYNDVFKAVKSKANIETEGKTFSADSLNKDTKNITLQYMYWDFVASVLNSNNILYLKNELDGESFKSFALAYKDKDSADEPTLYTATQDVKRSSFEYSNVGGKMWITLSYPTESYVSQGFDVQSYTYQNCTATD